MKHLRFNNLNIVYTEISDGNMKDPSIRKDFLEKNKIKNLLIPLQKHTNRVIKDFESGDADGIFTSKKNTPVGVLTADCMPIVITDFSNLCVVHAGWKGLVNGILENAAELFEGKAKFAFIGVSARKCCYEVKEDFVRQNKINRKFIYKKGDKLTFSLQEMATEILKKSGIKKVVDISLCSICSDSFFSYRKGNFNERILTYAYLEE